MGNKRFSAADIRKIVSSVDLFVFPQANPDGRQWSMTKDPMWRKNRRPAPSGSSGAACVGVDLNRNFDFLWKYPKYFDPSAPIQNSTDACDPEVYIGPGVFSEPETQNVKWLFDTHPNIRFFVDLHSYGELLMYTWGDATDQTTTPAMNFRNPAYDGKRRATGARSYKEFVTADDRSVSVVLARRMQTAIKAVRGTKYGVEQDFAMYPTAGCSDDYATSRQFVGGGMGKVHAFTVEWGKQFQPPYAEMQAVMEEMTAGLLAFCLAAISVS